MPTDPEDFICDVGVLTVGGVLTQGLLDEPHRLGDRLNMYRKSAVSVTRCDVDQRHDTYLTEWKMRARFKSRGLLQQAAIDLDHYVTDTIGGVETPANPRDIDREMAVDEAIRMYEEVVPDPQSGLFSDVLSMVNEDTMMREHSLLLDDFDIVRVSTRNMNRAQTDGELVFDCRGRFKRRDDDAEREYAAKVAEMMGSFIEAQDADTAKEAGEAFMRQGR